MAKTSNYNDWLGSKLKSPTRAARYLNGARQESVPMFLKALRKVAEAQSRSMTDLADAVKVRRESLYRIMSETGNPTYETLTGILESLGFRFEIVSIEDGENKPTVDSHSLKTCGIVVNKKEKGR